MTDIKFDQFDPQFHPACELFPRMPDEELRSLADDIKENGLLEPIVVHEGKIHDGRCRFEACECVGVEPHYVEWDGDCSPATRVISKNIQRRHLTASQRAAIAVELLPLLQEEAKDRQRLSRGQGVKGAKQSSISKGKASEHAASILGCSSTIIEQANRAKKKAPELIQQVRDGLLTAKNAADLSDLPELKRQEVLKKIGKPKAKVARIIRQAEIDCMEEKRKAIQKSVKLPNTSDIQIWNGDCLTLMKERIKPKSVDVAATSVPYNVGIKYETYADNLDEEHYLDWLDDIFASAKEVLKDEGSFFLNVGATAKKPWLAVRVMEVATTHFKLQNQIVWAKSLAIAGRSIGQFRPVRSKRHLTPCHETIFHFTKKGDVEIDRLAVGVPFANKNSLHRFNVDQDLRCAGNVWVIPHDSTKSRRDRWSHPCPFPVELAERCIKLHGITEGMTVLDPFNGVGSSTVAMARLGVKGMGIEIDEAYCQSAKARLLAEQQKTEDQRFHAAVTPVNRTMAPEFYRYRKELHSILDDCLLMNSDYSKTCILKFFNIFGDSTSILFDCALNSLPRDLRNYYDSLPLFVAS